MDTDKSSQEEAYLSFTKREDDTDYTRWTLLRQADKSASLQGKKDPAPAKPQAAPSSSAKPAFAGLFASSAPKRQATDPGDGGRIPQKAHPAQDAPLQGLPSEARQDALQGPATAAPSRPMGAAAAESLLRAKSFDHELNSKGRQDSTIAQMLESSSRKAGSLPGLSALRSTQGPAAARSNGATAQGLPRNVTPFGISACRAAEAAPEARTDASGHMVFTSRRPDVSSLLAAAAAEGAERKFKREDEMLDAKSFDYSALEEQRKAALQDRSIADLLNSHPIKQAPATAAGWQGLSKERMRGEAADALKRASTLEQLRSDAAYEEDLKRSGANGGSSMKPYSMPPRDQSGHVVFTSRKPSAPLERPAVGATQPQMAPRAPAMAPAEPGRWNTGLRDPLAQAAQQGPARFSRLFSGSSRMRAPGRRRESLKEIYRRIESCQ